MDFYSEYNRNYFSMFDDDETDTYEYLQRLQSDKKRRENECDDDD